MEKIEKFKIKIKIDKLDAEKNGLLRCYTEDVHLVRRRIKDKKYVFNELHTLYPSFNPNWFNSSNYVVVYVKGKNEINMRPVTSMDGV